MRPLYLLTAISLVCSIGAALAEDIVGTPRVALVYSDFGDFRHRDDYDARMKELGWRMDKYENTQFAEFADKLASYDILLGSALFNYSNVQDLAAHKEALLQFMHRGGAIVSTDTNYAQHGAFQKQLAAHDITGVRGNYAESWTVFWITAHFLNAAAQFQELGVPVWK